MSNREFGHYLRLNHIPSSSQRHVAEYKLAIQNKLHKQRNLYSKEEKVYPENFTLLSKYKMPILDQGSLGSCVATSYASIVQSLTGENLPSRLYMYFNALIGTDEDPRYDIGLDVLQSLPIFTKYGLLDESNWPYNETKFGVLPPIKAYQNASFDIDIKTKPIPQTDKAIKDALLKDNFIIFGMLIYTSFLSADVEKTGIVPMPVVTKETIEGGHCMHIVGWTKYKDIDYYIVRNSWGDSWGHNGDPINPLSNKGRSCGFCFIPAEMILAEALTFELVGVSHIKD